MFSDKLHRSLFPDRFPHYAWTGPLQLCWVKGVWVLRCNLLPALLAEWPGSFTYHCGNRSVEWTRTKSQRTKWTHEKKFLRPLLLGFRLTTFWSRVQHLPTSYPGCPVCWLLKWHTQRLLYSTVWWKQPLPPPPPPPPFLSTNHPLKWYAFCMYVLDSLGEQQEPRHVSVILY